MKLMVNGEIRDLSDDYLDDTLLWALRDGLGLAGTKYGCGIGVCGACTVRVDGALARACTIPAADVAGKRIETVEGLVDEAGNLHPVQQAFVEHQVPQCAWCMNGQIMTAVQLLEDNPAPREDEIVTAMNNNYCRCGCYARIKVAVSAAATSMEGPADE